MLVYYKFLPNFAKFCQIFAKFCQILTNFTFIPIFLIHKCLVCDAFDHCSFHDFTAVV